MDVDKRKAFSDCLTTSFASQLDLNSLFSTKLMEDPIKSITYIIKNNLCDFWHISIKTSGELSNINIPIPSHLKMWKGFYIHKNKT